MFTTSLIIFMESVFPQNWNKIGTKVHVLSGFEILSKSINIARYVFKFIYLISSDLRWNVCEGFVGLQLYL